MCDRLLADGYIERSVSEESRREVVLTLSAQGRMLVRNETARRRRAIRTIVSRLSREEQLELVDALTALGVAAEHERGDAWRLGWTA
jgi:DNA-binding MarR family transcriptional regulator